MLIRQGVLTHYSLVELRSNTVNLEIFVRVSRNGKITLSFTDIGISCPSREFLTSQICLLMLGQFNKELNGTFARQQTLQNAYTCDMNGNFVCLI